MPAGSRATRDKGLRNTIDDKQLAMIRRLNDIAASRGQTLAQMALAWILRGGRVTSALIGASSVEQLESNLGALNNLEFTPDELAAIDKAMA